MTGFEAICLILSMVLALTGLITLKRRFMVISILLLLAAIGSLILRIT